MNNNRFPPSADILGLGITPSSGADYQLEYSRGLALGRELAGGADPTKLFKGRDAATRQRFELFKQLESEGKIKKPELEPVVESPSQALPDYSTNLPQRISSGAEDILGIYPQQDPIAAYMAAQQAELDAQEEDQMAATMGADFNVG